MRKWTLPDSRVHRTILGLAYLFVLRAPTAGYTAQAASDADSVVITNVTVIDMTGNAPKARMNVLIEDGYISAISADDVGRPAGATIEGSGRFLIPGLWDMHAHWENIEGILPNAEDFLGLFVANGVTSVRMMSGAPEHYAWRARTYEDGFVSPRIIIGSNIVDGPMKVLPWSVSASTETEGRRLVRQFHEIGADFIKVYEGLAPDVYLAIADESRRLGIPFAGTSRLQSTWKRHRTQDRRASNTLPGSTWRCLASAS